MLLTILFFASSLSFALSEPSSQAQSFSLTTEEMVFASKLSDEKRHLFCYRFSPRERALAMSQKELSPDERISYVLQMESSAALAQPQEETQSQ
jgi:hypothetical protein